MVMTAVILVMVVSNVAVILLVGLSQGSSIGAEVGGGDGGSHGSSGDGDGLMPRGGEGDALGPPDEVHEDVEGPAAPEEKE